MSDELSLSFDLDPPVSLSFDDNASSDGLWKRSSGVLHPKIISNSVAIGATTLSGSEKLRVVGEVYGDSYRVGRTVIYPSGGGSIPVGSIVTERNFLDEFTLHRIANVNESTLSLVRIDGDGEDLELIDFYNMDYNDPEYGMRIYKRGTGSYRSFNFEYSDGTNYLSAYSILPRNSVNATNDIEFRIGNILSFKTANTYITKDVDNNLVFTDQYISPVSLSFLAERVSVPNPANGLSVVDNINTYTISLTLANEESPGAMPTLSGNVTDYMRGNGTWGTIHSAVTLGTANGLSLNVQELSLGLADTDSNGALSSTDWNTFNNKENSLGNPSTSGYVLSSTDGGVRSWVPLIGGAGGSTILKDFITDVGNIGASEYDLYTYTITGGTISEDGDKLVAEYCLISNDTGSGDITIKIYFAGQTIFTRTNAVGANIYKANLLLIRTSSTTCRVIVKVSLENSSQRTIINSSLVGLDFTVSNIIKITASTTSPSPDNTVVAKFGYIERKKRAI